MKPTEHQLKAVTVRIVYDSSIYLLLQVLFMILSFLTRGYEICCCYLLLLLLLFSHINSCQKIYSPWSLKGAGALRSSEKLNEIEIRPGNTTLSRLKTHDTKEGAQVKRSNVQTELTWPRVSTQLQHRVTPFPHLTNSRLQTTAVGLPTPHEPHRNRECRRTRLLSGVRSEW